MQWSFKGCGKCNGDLILEGDEWRCVHCGRYYYPNVVQVMDSGAVLSQLWATGSGAAASRSDSLVNVVEA